MALDNSVASPRVQAGDDRVAYALLIAFLAAIFFLNGAISNAVVILSFAASWIAVARNPQIELPELDALTIIFIAAIALRLLLPPDGTTHALPGSGVTRALLIAGLYGLTLYVYEQVPFRHILLLIVAVAFLSAVISMLAYILEGRANERLSFLGRASHPIIGAGAMASAVLAGIASLLYLQRGQPSGPFKIMLGIATIVLIAAIAMTGSRGPVMALVLAIATTPIAMQSRSRALPVIFALGAWAIVTSSVIFEPQIREALCPTIEFACRPSLRQGVWLETAHMVAQNPLWGAGYGFRFQGVPHAHNSYFGMALNYGIPLLLLFVSLMVTALSQATRMKHNNERFFVIASLIFANGFMGSDLSDPMRFFSTHYLFLWFPLILALVSEKLGRPSDNDRERERRELPPSPEAATS